MFNIVGNNNCCFFKYNISRIKLNFLCPFFKVPQIRNFRNLYFKRASLVQLRIKFNGPIHKLYESLSNCQTETCSSVFFYVLSLPLYKWIKYLFLHLF